MCPGTLDTHLAAVCVGGLGFIGVCLKGLQADGLLFMTRIWGLMSDLCILTYVGNNKGQTGEELGLFYVDAVDEHYLNGFFHVCLTNQF